MVMKTRISQKIWRMTFFSGILSKKGDILLNKGEYDEKTKHWFYKIESLIKCPELPSDASIRNISNCGN